MPGWGFRSPSQCCESLHLGVHAQYLNLQLAVLSVIAWNTLRRLFCLSLDLLQPRVRNRGLQRPLVLRKRKFQDTNIGAEWKIHLRRKEMKPIQPSPEAAVSLHLWLEYPTTCCEMGDNPVYSLMVQEVKNLHTTQQMQEINSCMGKIPWRRKQQLIPWIEENIPWKNPMDRGAWHATVHRVTARHDWACTLAWWGVTLQASLTPLMILVYQQRGKGAPPTFTFSNISFECPPPGFFQLC